MQRQLNCTCSQRNRFDDLLQLVKTYPQFLGIGIDEATAIMVRGHVATVLGDHHVFFLDADPIDASTRQVRVTKLEAGDRYDLKLRRHILDEKQPAVAEPAASRNLKSQRNQ